MKVSLIIPFKDEKEYAELTMSTAYEFMNAKGRDFELIAVDDSTDGTWDILKKFETSHEGVIVIRGGEPPRYGKALRAGYSVASGDIIMPFNGDLCDSLDDVISYVEHIESGYDMMFGSRYMKGGRILDHPSAKVVLSRFGNLFIRTLFGVKCNDMTNTFKAYRREVLEDVRPQADGYELGLETALKAVKKGYRYKTIPITWTGRQYGVSKMAIANSLVTHLKTALKIRFS